MILAIYKGGFLPVITNIRGVFPRYHYTNKPWDIIIIGRSSLRLGSFFKGFLCKIKLRKAGIDNGALYHLAVFHVTKGLYWQVLHAWIPRSAPLLWPLWDFPAFLVRLYIMESETVGAKTWTGMHRQEESHKLWHRDLNVGITKIFKKAVANWVVSFLKFNIKEGHNLQIFVSCLCVYLC